MAYSRSFGVAAIGALLLVGVVFGVYSRVLHAAFIFDDAATVINNPSIVQLWPLIRPGDQGGPLNPPSNRPTSARPVANLTFAVNYAIGRLDTASYHATNIGIHAVATLLLWMIVWRTLQLDCFQGRFNDVAGLLAFAAALVWAVHPLNTESVAYVTQRTESMMGLFYLTALYTSLRYWSAASGGARAGWLAVATLAGVLGMLSKEMMASAIAMVLLFERTFVRVSFREALRQSWPLYVGLALGWLPVLAINYHGPRTPLAGFHLGVPAHVWWLTQTDVVIRFFKLAFWPWPLVIHYEVPYLRTLGDAWPWLLPVIGLIGVTIALVRRKTATGFVLAWFFAVLSPTLLIPLPGETMAERRMYVPLMAMVPLVVVGAYVLLRRILQGARPPLVAVSSAALLLAGVFSAVTFHRLAAYQTELAIWEDAVRYQPNDALVQVNYGTSLAKAGQRERAMEHFEQALVLDPANARAHFNLGDAKASRAQLLLLRGQEEESRNLAKQAIAHFEAAIRGEPDDFFARFNLGQALLSDGRTSEAVKHFEIAVQARPDFAAAHNNLGVALTALGRPAEAIPHFEQAVKLEPDAESYVNLLRAYALINRPADAIATWTKAIEHARKENKSDLVAELEVGLAGYRAATTGASPERP